MVKKRPLTEDPASRAWFMIFLVLVGVGFLIFIDFNRRLWNPPPERPPSGRHWGNPEAELKITEFVDFQSGECARGQQILSEFISKHPAGVNLQTRFFPQEDRAVTLAQYAQCAAGQKKFHKFTEILYEKYFSLMSLTGFNPAMKEIIKETGLDPAAMQKCMDDPATMDIITDDRSLGESLFVRSTPSYILNGKLYPGVDELQKALKTWDIALTQDE